MDKQITAKDAVIATIVAVTPGQLREMANLLELCGQRATPAETVLVKLNERIMLSYRPSVKAIDQLQEKIPKPLMPLGPAEDWERSGATKI